MLEINLRWAKYQSYIFVIFHLSNIKANNQLSGIYICSSVTKMCIAFSKRLFIRTKEEEKKSKMNYMNEGISNSRCRAVFKLVFSPSVLFQLTYMENHCTSWYVFLLVWVRMSHINLNIVNETQHKSLSLPHSLMTTDLRSASHSLQNISTAVAWLFPKIPAFFLEFHFPWVCLLLYSFLAVCKLGQNQACRLEETPGSLFKTSQTLN